MSTISDKDFLKFKWPPKMPSYSFKKRGSRYLYVAYIYANATLQTDDKPLNVFHFKSERKAKAFKERMNEAMEKPIIILARMHAVGEDGWAR